jgi:hypothetical protein
MMGWDWHYGRSTWENHNHVEESDRDSESNTDEGTDFEEGCEGNLSKVEEMMWYISVYDQNKTILIL